MKALYDELNYLMAQASAAKKLRQELPLSLSDKRILLISAIRMHQLSRSLDAEPSPFDNIVIDVENNLPHLKVSEKFITKYFPLARRILTDDFLLETIIRSLTQALETTTALLRLPTSELLAEERIRLEERQGNILQELLTLDRQKLEQELFTYRYRAKERSYFIAHYIENTRALLENYHSDKPICLQSMDLSYIDLSPFNVDLQGISLIHCNVKEANFRHTRISADQLKDNFHFSTVVNVPADIINEARQLKFDHLQARLRNGIANFQYCLDLIDALDQCHLLICWDTPPQLPALPDEIFLNMAYCFLSYVNLNMLAPQHIFAHTKVCERGYEHFIQQGRAVIEPVLYAALVACQYRVSSEDIAELKCSKFQALTLPIQETTSQLRHDVKKWFAELTAEQCQTLEKQLEGLTKLQEHLRVVHAEHSYRYDQQYIIALVANLQGNLYATTKTPQERMDQIMPVADQQPKLVVDITNCQLTDIDLSRYDLTKVRLRLTYNQAERYLTSQQRQQRTRALCQAIKANDLRLMKQLLDDGVDPDLPVEGEAMPLKIACKLNRVDLAKELLIYGAKVDYPTPGLTLIQVAARHKNRELAQLLKSAGAKVDKVSAIQLNLLEEAAKYQHDIQRGFKNHNAEEALLLHTAVEYQAIAIAQWLIEGCGADPNVTNAQDQNVLHIACRLGEPVMVEFLLQHAQAINIEQQDKRKQTPLQLLIEKLAEERAKPRGQQDGIKLQAQQKIADMLIAKGASLDVKSAIILGDIQAAKRLYHSQRHYSDRSGYTALLLATNYNQVELVDWLIEQHVDLEETNTQSETALMIASKNGLLAIVRLLIHNGACINPVSKATKPPLIAAIEANHPLIVQLLLAHEANVQAIWCEKSALHIAAQKGYSLIVGMLLEKGADAFAKDSQGNLPIHVAGNTATLATLLTYYINPDNAQRESVMTLKQQQQDESSIELIQILLNTLQMSAVTMLEEPVRQEEASSDTKETVYEEDERLTHSPKMERRVSEKADSKGKAKLDDDGMASAEALTIATINLEENREEVIARETVRLRRPVSYPIAYRKSLEEADMIKTALGLADDIILGRAIDDGGSFFDALAQALNARVGERAYTEKSLRMACCDFYQQNKNLVDQWNREDFQGDEPGEHYYENVQYTQPELEQHFDGRAPVWGRPHVEGRMLCQMLAPLKKLVVIEIMQTPEFGIRYELIKARESKEISIDSEENSLPTLIEKMPILVVTQQQRHFVPLLLKHQLIQRTQPPIERLSIDAWHTNAGQLFRSVASSSRRNEEADQSEQASLEAAGSSLRFT